MAKKKKIGRPRKKRKHTYRYKIKHKRKGKKTEIKLYIFNREKISKDGYMRWSPKLRRYVKPFVYGRQRWRIDVPVRMIDTKEKIGDLLIEHIGIEGYYYIMGMSHGKTKTHYKWVTLARVKLKMIKGELKAFVNLTDSRGISRLPRYWFWKDS